MSNVFKKLISKEMGEGNYKRYSTFTKKNQCNQLNDNQILFNDMYDKLKYRDMRSISKMHNRLNDTLLLALRINKNFLFAFLFFLIGFIYIITKDLNINLTVISLTSMGVCFSYKAYEYLINKFCYIDAQIVLVYKAVLDRIILKEGEKYKEGKKTYKTWYKSIFYLYISVII